MRVVPVRALCVALAVAGVGALGGCGAHRALAPAYLRSHAAEPAHDPRLGARPAGRSVRVGADPQGIAVAAGRGLVAVGVHNPSGIVLLSSRSGRVLRRIRIAYAPRHLQLVGPEGPLLVPEEGVNRVLEMSLPSGRVRSFRVGPFPHDAGAVGGSIVVADERGGELTRISPTGRTQPIGGFTQPGGVAAVGSDAAVVDVGAFTLTLVDVQSGRRVGRLPAGAGPSHVVAAAGRIYVADTRGGQIITYGVHPFRRLGVTAVPHSPYGIALDPDRHRLWVTQTGLNRVSELSLSGALPQVVATYPTGLQPDTVAVDTVSGRVFVANQVSGTVENITPRPHS